MVDITLTHSPIEHMLFAGEEFFIKRDDLLSPEYSGNKARKLFYLLESEFPGVSKVVCHGSPQSNLLYSLSALAKLKSWQFDYYVDHIPTFLREHPSGNYLAALENGANIIALQEKGIRCKVNDHIQELVLKSENNSLFVPEGGSSPLAEHGVKLLAEEIVEWASKNNLNNLQVVLPSGTGTTALYLQKHLPFEVLTCACVGGMDYLKKQFMDLSSNPMDYPTVLSTDKKYHFGKLYDEFYRMWLRLKEQAGIEFELLYDPLGWITLLEYIKKRKAEDEGFQPIVLYVHQGGVLGNQTMLPRYQRRMKNAIR